MWIPHLHSRPLPLVLAWGWAKLEMPMRFKCKKKKNELRYILRTKIKHSISRSDSTRCPQTDTIEDKWKQPRMPSLIEHSWEQILENSKYFMFKLPVSWNCLLNQLPRLIKRGTRDGEEEEKNGWLFLWLLMAGWLSPVLPCLPPL